MPSALVNDIEPAQQMLIRSDPTVSRFRTDRRAKTWIKKSLRSSHQFERRKIENHKPLSTRSNEFSKTTKGNASPVLDKGGTNGRYIYSTTLIFES